MSGCHAQVILGKEHGRERMLKYVNCLNDKNLINRLIKLVA